MSWAALANDPTVHCAISTIKTRLNPRIARADTALLRISSDVTVPQECFVRARYGRKARRLGTEIRRPSLVRHQLFRG